MDSGSKGIHPRPMLREFTSAEITPTQQIEIEILWQRTGQNIAQDLNYLFWVFRNSKRCRINLF